MSQNLPDEVVRAKAFEVVNDDGVVVARLYADQDGRPHFTLYTRDGSDRLGMFIDRRGEPHIVLSGQNPSARITIGMSNLGDGKSSPTLTLRDAETIVGSVGSGAEINLTTRAPGRRWAVVELECQDNSICIALGPKPFMVMGKEGKDRWWRP